MIITVKEKEYKIEFTFNSFKHLEDFDINDLNNVENNPFKMPLVTRKLLFGALNHDPKVYFTDEEVDKILEDYMEDENIGDLLTELVEVLQNSSFFKSLQKKNPKGKKK